MQTVTTETLFNIIVQVTLTDRELLAEVLLTEGRALHYAGLDKSDLEEISLRFRQRFGFIPRGTTKFTEYTLKDILAELNRIH
jgi:hypothetical protein